MACLAFSVDKAAGCGVAAARGSGGGCRDRGLFARGGRRRRGRSRCLRAMIVRRRRRRLLGGGNRSCGRGRRTRGRWLCRRLGWCRRCCGWCPLRRLRLRDVCRRWTRRRLRCALLHGGRRRRLMRGGKQASSNEADCNDKDGPVSQRLADSRPHRRLSLAVQGDRVFRPFGIAGARRAPLESKARN
jgi:hypothetical protein